jgi:hypothetical protein
MSSFAYSFDRQSFIGAYETRQAAYVAGVRRAMEFPTSIEAVFVGERVPADPQVCGHAAGIIREMRRRAIGQSGDAAGGYLRRVHEHQEADLDEAVAQAVLAWLARHELTPGFFRVQRVTEMPMPLGVAAGGTASDKTTEEPEVQELGDAGYSPD